MKKFQIICGFLLVVSVFASVMVLKADADPVHVVLIEDPQFPSLNSYARSQLEDLAGDSDHFSYQPLMVAFQGDDFKNKLLGSLTLEGSIVMGCFSEACKLEVISVLDEKPTPFFYTGRSTGLITKPYLWNFGSVFNQSIQPILALMETKSFSEPIILGDESIESVLTAKILKDIFTARSLNWKELHNIDLDSTLLSIESLDKGLETAFLISTSCNKNGWNLLEALANTHNYIFHTCSHRFTEIDSERIWYSASVDDSGLSEIQFFIEIATSFLREELERGAFNVERLSNMEFSVRNQMAVMDAKNQHVWHSRNIYSLKNKKVNVQQRGNRIIRPVVFPIFRQKSEWSLSLELYWRNHNGSWRS